MNAILSISEGLLHQELDNFAFLDDHLAKDFWRSQVTARRRGIYGRTKPSGTQSRADSNSKGDQFTAKTTFFNSKSLKIIVLFAN
jgi:hypothetical protein